MRFRKMFLDQAAGLAVEVVRARTPFSFEP